MTITSQQRGVAALLSATRRIPTGAVGASLGASSSILAVNVATGVLLARVLGPHGRGDLAAVLLWPSLLAAIGSLGVPQAATYVTARRSWPVGTVIGSALVLALAESVVLIALGVSLVPRILHHYSDDVRGFALIFLAFVPMNLVTLFLQAILNGLNEYRRFQMTRVLVIVASASLLCALTAGHHLSVGSAMVSYLAANGLTTLAVVALTWRAVPDLQLRCHRSLLRDLLAFGVKSHTSMVSSTLNQRLDQLLISVFLSPVRLGLYVVAVTMSSLGSLIGTSVSMVVLPAVSSLRRREDQRAAVRRYVAMTLLLCAVVTAPLLVATSQAISLFFGSAFESVTNVCRVLLVASVVLGVNRALTAALTGLNRPLEAGIAETVALLFTAIGLAALLPTMGLMGAAIASLIAYAVSTLFMLMRASRALGVAPLTLLVPRRMAPAGLEPIAGADAQR